MKLFGWKSAGRASARPVHSYVPLMPLQRTVGEWPRSYEAQVREGYLHNPVAQRAVRMVAEGVGGAPLACSDGAALALVTETTAGQSLLETLSAQLLLHGNAYIQIACDAGGRPVALFALRPERVKIEGDVRGWPAAFVYTLGGAATRFAADAIIHIEAMNPLDDLYGAGALGAAAGASPSGFWLWSGSAFMSGFWPNSPSGEALRASRSRSFSSFFFFLANSRWRFS